MYFANRTGDTANYLALNHKLDRYISTVESTINLVKANKRSKHQVTISFDEWNVWYHSNAEDRAVLEGSAGWPHAPRLLEDNYNFEDVLQVALILNTFIRKSNIVKMACIAQLVNVIAPIMTEPGGAAWRQTIYYPYYFASIFGRGTALHLSVDCPGYACEHSENVPYLDVAGVQDAVAGTLTFFAVNRHSTQVLALDLALQGFCPKARVIDHQVMADPDLRATNTLAAPDRVVPREGVGAAVAGGRLTANLAPLSWHMIRVKLG